MDERMMAGWHQPNLTDEFEATPGAGRGWIGGPAAAIHGVTKSSSSPLMTENLTGLTD